MSDQDEIISDDEVSPGAWFMLEIFIKQILGDRAELTK